MKFFDLVKERFRRSNSKRSFHKIILENLKILPRKGRRKEKIETSMCLFTYISLHIYICLDSISLTDEYRISFYI